MAMGRAGTPVTPILEFYRGTTIFLTGGTGFMGMVLIEKLLRTCNNLNKIFLLIRQKKGKAVETRFDEIFEDPVFATMKGRFPKYREKVALIAGDCSQVGLGMSSEDRQRIIDEVDIVFHGAATVRFNEHLKTATAINIRGTKEMFELAQEIKNLKCFMHISTAYCNCHLDEIREQFYESPIHYNKIIDIAERLDENELNSITAKLLDPWPNTYTLTKAVAEDVVKELGLGLPVGVFRPAIVTSTREEPVPGWTNNIYGPTGVLVGTALGIMHVLHANFKVDSNMVPVDMTIDGLMAAAWEVSSKHSVSSRKEDIPIYNYVSSLENNLTWGSFMMLVWKHGADIPVTQMLWYPSLILNSNKYLVLLLTFLLHFLPALVMDAAAVILRKEVRMVKVYKKIMNFSEVLSYFANKSWIFTNDNVRSLWRQLTPEDQAIFKFDMKLLDWEEYFYNFNRGGRKFIVKEDPDTIPAAKKKLLRLYYLHITTQTVVYLIGLRIVWGVLNKAISFYSSSI